MVESVFIQRCGQTYVFRFDRSAKGWQAALLEAVYQAARSDPGFSLLEVIAVSRKLGIVM